MIKFISQYPFVDILRSMCLLLIIFCIPVSYCVLHLPLWHANASIATLEVKLHRGTSICEQQQ